MVLEVNVEFTAKDADKAVKQRDLIIVVDVLRSSSTIINALANGAKTITPTKTLKEAYRLHRQHPDYLLAGERKGDKPKGFNLGNSPLQFTREQVQGRNIIITTTSGTEALTRCRQAKWVLVAAFLNAEATAEKAIEIAEKQQVNISFVLAGDKGRFSLEDFICSGAIADRFPVCKVSFLDKTQAALHAFRHVKNNLCETVMKSEHAKHLIRLGLKRDIEFSCQLDIARVVPIYRDDKMSVLEQRTSRRP